jgi:hypothetical protein
MDLNSGASMIVGTTSFLRGAAIPMTSRFNGVHMDAFPTGTWVQGNWDASNLTTQNPVKWLTYTQTPGTIPAIFPYSADGKTQVTFPLEGTRKWFEVKIRIVRPDFALNKIRVTLNDNQSSVTGDFLEDPAAAEINFNGNTAVQRDNKNINPIQKTGQLITTAVWTNEKNGARIYPGDMGTAEKFIAIRYFIIKEPTHIQVQTIDINENEIARADFIFPGTCIGCNGTGPRPPSSLAVAQSLNGIKLTWTSSPDDASVLFYSIYRRPANSTEIPKSIAVVPKTFKFYEDRIDAPGNTLALGQTYRYSIACIGNSEEGCNGPTKPKCTGSKCPLACVAEQSATTPAMFYNVCFKGKTVSSAIPDLKAKNQIIIQQDNINSGGSINFTAGNRIDISDVTVSNGGKSTITIDPAIK